MDHNNKLNTIIDDFILNKIDGPQFEEQYSAIYDFEEIEDDVSYFKKTRYLLEKFTPFNSDIQNFPDYYIDENQLRLEILNLKKP